jgi:hypothetical protein
MRLLKGKGKNRKEKESNSREKRDNSKRINRIKNTKKMINKMNKNRIMMMILKDRLNRIDHPLNKKYHKFLHHHLRNH